MTNRYHLPLVVTTVDDVDRDEAAEYVERLLSDLETAEAFHRAYIENTSIDDGEARRLLDMLERIDVANIESAADAIDTIASDEEDTDE